MNNKNNFFTFFCLYIAQQIPMSFFATIIPVIMRQEKFSLSTIGFIVAFIKIPWILKFLWSPVVDRFNVTVKDYKRWIILSEIVFAGFIFSVAFFDLLTSFYAILALLILSFFASATQDIATDGLATQSFDRKNKSMINSMISMGRFGGALLGGGVLLWFYQKIGWSNINFFLAGLVIVALLPLYFNQGLTINREKSVTKQVILADIFWFFFQRNSIWKKIKFTLFPHLFIVLPHRRKEIGKQVGFLVLYYISMIGSIAMISPYLVDLGYDMKQISMMRGFLGPAAGVVASFTGGLIVRKIGRHRSRLLFAVFMLIAACYLFLISRIAHPDVQLLYVGIFLLWGSYGMATVYVYTSAMDHARKGREGTDFTIQTVTAQLSGICIVTLSGKIAHSFGYNTLFLFEFVLACLALTYILLAFRKKTEND